MLDSRRTILSFTVQESTGVGEARRASVDLARQLGFNDVHQGEVAIIVTELATNLVKHAGGGELLVRPVETQGVPGVEVLALDRAAGLANPGEVLRDGYSTAGTPGTGLGAVSRLASRFDLYSTPGAGTAVLARVNRAPAGEAAFDVGVVQSPYPGETVCGDGFMVLRRPERLVTLVVDGLGHGLGARDAANAALEAFAAHAAAPGAELLEAVHRGMRGTRGGVAGITTLDRAARTLTFSGMGNISATLVSGAGRRGLVSQNGTLGLTQPRRQEYSLPYQPGDALVVHSDGLSSAWNLDRYPGLSRKPAALIAGVLYRDHRRGRDDVTVLVVKPGAA